MSDVSVSDAYVIIHHSLKVFRLARHKDQLFDKFGAMIDIFPVHSHGYSNIPSSISLDFW